MAEAQRVKDFWGDPTPLATQQIETDLQARLDKAASGKSALIDANSPYFPTEDGPFGDIIANEYRSQNSKILQYPKEAQFVMNFLTQNRVSSYFEVGLRHGAFALFLKQHVGLEQVGGSELIETAELERLRETEDLRVFIGDHNSPEYAEWRQSQDPFEFVFIDGNHQYYDAVRDYHREKAFRPKYLGFHDIWNISCLGAKKLWDELNGKLVAYYNTDPGQTLFVANRARNVGSEWAMRERDAHGFCCGIGIVALG
ncbi:MAG: hypothetical protein AAFV62_00440 [Pseudomonadota bacterium]